MNKKEPEIEFYEYGLPLRSNYNIKKEESKYYNPNLEFDIYDKSQQVSNFKVDSFDPTSGIVFQLDEEEETINNYNNEYAFFIYDNMCNLLKNKFLIYNLGFVNFFGMLYHAISTNNDKNIEIKNYFNFNNKDLVLYDLINNNNILNNNKNINIKNIILLYTNNLNSDYIKYVSKVCQIYNLQNININKLNQDLNNYFENKITNILKSSMLNNLINNREIICISMGIISPYWMTKFDKVVKEQDIELMVSYKKSYYYYEDENYQVIELITDDNLLSFGFIKSNNQIFTNNIYNDIQKNLRLTVMDKVIIPKISFNSKIRYNSILKNTGLTEIYNEIGTNELSEEKIKMGDLIQNILIVLDNKGKMNNLNGGIRNKSCNFIIKNNFSYYVKIRENNNIIITGYY
jgi:hypothetical protein